MNSPSFANWIYNGSTATDRPADLGYYVGYRICEAYYKTVKDKRKAIRDILNIKDFPTFVAASKYSL